MGWAILAKIAIIVAAIPLLPTPNIYNFYFRPNSHYSCPVPKITSRYVQQKLVQDLQSDPFFQIVAFLESSEGKLLNHKKIKYGIHQGTSAIGAYGLMPVTIKDYVLRNKTLYKKYSHLINENTDFETVKNISAIHYELYKDVLTAYKKDLDRRFDNLEQKLYAWKHGMNKAALATEDEILEDEYLIRYKKYIENK